MKKLKRFFTKNIWLVFAAILLLFTISDLIKGWYVVATIDFAIAVLDTIIWGISK